MPRTRLLASYQSSWMQARMNSSRTAEPGQCAEITSAITGTRSKIARIIHLWNSVVGRQIAGAKPERNAAGMVEVPVATRVAEAGRPRSPLHPNEAAVADELEAYEANGAPVPILGWASRRTLQLPPRRHAHRLIHVVFQSIEQPAQHFAELCAVRVPYDLRITRGAPGPTDG